MKYKSYTVYDDQEFFNSYIALRNRPNSANNLLEKPIIDELITDVKGKAILELGCGEGTYGKELLTRGAQSYTGLEGSQNMFDLAQANLATELGTVVHTSIEGYDYPSAHFDLIVSRLVLHYIEHLEELLTQLNQSLKPGGEFIFSIEHPIITSCYEAYQGTVKRRYWIVDNYFSMGARINKWIGKEVVKYHRTIEEHIRLAHQTGFVLHTIRESQPQQALFSSEEEYERRKRIPLFMFFHLKKRD